MPRSLAVLLVLAATISAQSQNVDVRLAPLPRGTFIVEFQRSPGVAAAATLERFRREVPATLPKRRMQAQSATLAIRYEYAHAMLGAAIEVPAESLDAIRRLPYVRAVHPDRGVTAYAARGARSTAAAIDAAARVNAGALGTHVAGIIAADSPEIAGVAPAATLYATRSWTPAAADRRAT